jgi:hypothetical protein
MVLLNDFIPSIILEFPPKEVSGYELSLIHSIVFFNHSDQFAKHHVSVTLQLSPLSH